MMNRRGTRTSVRVVVEEGVYLPGILARCLGLEREQLLPIIPKKTVLGFHVVGVYVEEPAYLVLLEIGAFRVEEVEVRLSVGNVSRHTIKSGNWRAYLLLADASDGILGVGFDAGSFLAGPGILSEKPIVRYQISGSKKNNIPHPKGSSFPSGEPASRPS